MSGMVTKEKQAELRPYTPETLLSLSLLIGVGELLAEPRRMAILCRVLRLSSICVMRSLQLMM